MQLIILIPCYNEEKRLDFQSIQSFIASENSTRFVFVNDGSSDGTASMINAFASKNKDRIFVVHLEKNSGKAEAIRHGMLWIRKQNLDFEYAGFMDADLATPLSEIATAEEALGSFRQPAMAFGSRLKLFGSTQIERSLYRHLIGRIIATFISSILKLPIYDTQCGFKFFRKDVIEELFEEPFISRWLFDVEIIFRLLRKTGYENIHHQMFEFPVREWKETGDSKIPLSYAFRVPFELLRIRARYA